MSGDSATPTDIKVGDWSYNTSIYVDPQELKKRSEEDGEITLQRVAEEDSQYDMRNGGLAGIAKDSVILSCFARDVRIDKDRTIRNGLISSIDDIPSTGGLVGAINNTHVLNCYAEGQISGVVTGGLIGLTTGDDSQILKCYSNIMPQDVEHFSGLTNIVDKGYAQECFCMKAVGGSVADLGCEKVTKDELKKDVVARLQNQGDAITDECMRLYYEKETEGDLKKGNRLDRLQDDADFGAWEIRESGYPYPVKYKGHL